MRRDVAAAAVAVVALAYVATVATVRAVGIVGDVVRHDDGDTFTLSVKCDLDPCSQHEANNSKSGPGSCLCACPNSAPLFREDRETCVSDITECSLASFGTGAMAQKMPFVYLPLKGQILHPSKDITFPGVKTPICAVSGAQFLTRKGFVDLRNTLDADVPFTLFRDEGRTFLQWSGEPDLRTRMSGRVMLVRLLCRDVSATPSAAPLDLRGVFTPCVAFRVQGSPAHHVPNVSEVQFALNSATAEATSSGLTITEYIMIGISSLLLGLIYVASVFLYLHIKKKKKRALEESMQKSLKILKKKDGTPITEQDIVRINAEREKPLIEPREDGVVKKNPLLSLCRQYNDIKNFPSSSGTLSDSEDSRDNCYEESSRNQKQTISAIIHPTVHKDIKLRNEHYNDSIIHRDESGIERLPDEHVSIIETTDPREDRTEIVRPIGNTRRKLYFNPAYFEPQLMADPPPAALEFLVKIREVITIAKHKMAAKRFQPVLNEIPEEETYQSLSPSIDFYQGLGSQRSGSVVSLKRENSRKKPSSCIGCPGCTINNNDISNGLIPYETSACTTCIRKTRGDKQNSIRKWLEDIPTSRQNKIYNDHHSNKNGSLVSSLMSLPLNNSVRVRRQNSFHMPLYSPQGESNFSFRKKTSSVKSEPPIRSYNFPLPDFSSLEVIHNNHRFGPTVAKAQDIRPISFEALTSQKFVGDPLLTRKNKFITNKNVLPDMISEAMAVDSSKGYYHSSSDEEKLCNKQFQNLRTSPSRRSSPQIIDYETDSLERTPNHKGISTPTDYADVPSSQASPSLSVALPLEEELTMRNATYKPNSSNSNTPSPNIDSIKSPNHYEMIAEMPRSDQPATSRGNGNLETDYSLVSEVYVNNSFGSPPSSPSGSESSMGSRKLISNISNMDSKPGCLTIEVIDSPENYIQIHESDDFEPDTLDRKHSKNKAISELNHPNINDRGSSLSIEISNPPSHTIKLRSSGTFKKSVPVESDSIPNGKCNSLRHIYEQRHNTLNRPKLTDVLFSGSKSLDDGIDMNSESSIDWNSEEGRILTLELRHSKRQRQSTPPSIKQIKNLPRPDVLPPLPPSDEIPIYEQPLFPPRPVEKDAAIIDPKNVKDRSFSPRLISPTSVKAEHLKIQISNSVAPSCCHLGASVTEPYSDYENVGPSLAFPDNYERNAILSKHIANTQRFPKNNLPVVNSNTFVKNCVVEQRAVRRKKQSIEDSGYLSSDSASSPNVRKQIVLPDVYSASESGDSENEARSESGAESIETHSVFFGTIHRNSFRGSDRTINSVNSKISNFKRNSSGKCKR